ncbi:long-chain-fatty-acid--CoA ligase [Virgibacillus ainsalahensis]
MNISEQFSITAADQPNKTAYIFQDEKTSYRELEAQISRFASNLQQLGYKKGDHLALIMWNSPYFVIALYGALRIGVVVIPINPLYTNEEMRYILDNAEVKGIVSTDSLLKDFVGKSGELQRVEHYIIVESEDEPSYNESVLAAKIQFFSRIMEADGSRYERVPWNKDDTAIMLYTSGTTGRPKGVMLTFENVYANAFNNAKHLTFDYQDRVIVTLPMVHAFCIGAALCGPLLKGATLLILPKFSPSEVFRIAKTYKATIFPGVPTMYNYLYNTADKDNDLIDSFASIRLCISSGASLPNTMLNKFEKTFGVRIIEGYGLSEAAAVAYNPINLRKPGSIGKRVGQTEMKVVNKNGKEVEPGIKGELMIRGTSVMKGYYKMPEETAVSIEEGWLHTGDIARLDEDGYFYIVDREKDIIIVGGYNVYPKEVEEVLYTHPSISEVVVLGEPHPESGESVIAYVVVYNQPVLEEEVIHFCEGKLAKYKIPVKINFLDELPKTPSGKIIKKSIKV